MIIVITGPTCTGKSETALQLAKSINAEIVNGDVFQCYKEMNIGVAKPPQEFFLEVPHHLYSFVDINRNYSIADYQSDLRKKVEELMLQNKNIIIVGGSGLYIRSALFDYNFAKEAKVDMSKFEKLTNAELHSELEKIDSYQAETIHFNNRKRVLRAIEIFLSEGRTKTEIINSQNHKLLYNAKFFVRDMEREILYSRINQRVDNMINKGLLNEVESLVGKYGEECKAFQAIGYKELIPVIKGEVLLEEGIELIKKNSRNYAKRQMTFIRHQFPITFYKNTADLLEILTK